MALDLARVKQIPALFLAGNKDTPANVAGTEQLWRRGRAAGAPWTLLVEPDAKHRFASDGCQLESHGLVIPWLTAVIRQRVPQVGAPVRVIDGKTGWLGDPMSGEVWLAASKPESAADTSWFPDEASARGWQALRTGAALSR